MEVESLEIGPHANQEGLVRARRVNRDLGIGDLILDLVGWIGDEDLPETAVWPEPYPPRLDTPDNVGWVTRALGLNREQYEGACEIAKDLCENEEFQEAVELVARAAMIAPQIDHEGLETLRALTRFADESEVVLG